MAALHFIRLRGLKNDSVVVFLVFVNKFMPHSVEIRLPSVAELACFRALKRVLHCYVDCTTTKVMF